MAHLVASLAVSRRTKTAAARLGNDVGTMTVRIPCQGDRMERLWVTAGLTKDRRSARGRASVAIWAPVFRLLRAVGLLRVFVQHQRFMTTFVTYLPGPKGPVSILGAPVADLVPFSSAPGNTAVTFTALSYNGRLTVTVSCDPAVVDDVPSMTRAVQDELDGLVRVPGGHVPADPAEFAFLPGADNDVSSGPLP
jgi:hypothetical protein